MGGHYRDLNIFLDVRRVSVARPYAFHQKLSKPNDLSDSMERERSQPVSEGISNSVDC